VSFTTSPVTVVADVAVNSASIRPVGLASLEEKGIISSTVPSSIIARKLTAMAFTGLILLASILSFTTFFQQLMSQACLKNFAGCRRFAFSQPLNRCFYYSLVIKNS